LCRQLLAHLSYSFFLLVFVYKLIVAHPTDIFKTFFYFFLFFSVKYKTPRKRDLGGSTPEGAGYEPTLSQVV